ncbi:hypothetical protein SAMN06295945_0013 [Polynucleobacter meluiroseus]|uniref:Serine aminopeptidase, S33 n=1 Tax=Polynucleobacter meluiroseus TaxID=1938814 RepID=A0A240DXL6_9BURK|nr:hypothetical protein [Polynucleobacter meluiroseus]SNX27697.1 hypothetical protein SAMN06295945_0013 [Polynucleobacter meluiroseus]
MKLIKLLLMIAPLFSVSAQAQILDVSYEDDAPTRTLHLPAMNPQAVVLLFSGGSGILRLQNDGSTNSPHTFVRSKELWSQYGIDAVLVDTPYGLGDGRGNAGSTRDHQQRIFNVVKFYKEKLNLPIWLFGHSMGKVSVSEFVNGGKGQAQMTNGVIIAGTYQTVSMEEDEKLPVLAIHHLYDGCASTPKSTSERVIKSRPKDSRSQLILIDGGISTGAECMSFSHHGFNQNEEALVKEVAEFILKK